MIAAAIAVACGTAFAEPPAPPMVGEPQRIDVEAARPLPPPPEVGDPLRLDVEAARPLPPPPVVGEPLRVDVEAVRPLPPPPQAGEPRRLDVEADRPLPPPPEAGEPRRLDVEAARLLPPPPQAGEPRRVDVEAVRPLPPPPQAGEPRRVDVEAARPLPPPPEAGEPRRVDVTATRPADPWEAARTALDSCDFTAMEQQLAVLSSQVGGLDAEGRGLLGDLRREIQGREALARARTALNAGDRSAAQAVLEEARESQCLAAEIAALGDCLLEGCPPVQGYTDEYIRSGGWTPIGKLNRFCSREIACLDKPPHPKALPACDSSTVGVVIQNRHSHNQCIAQGCERGTQRIVERDKDGKPVKTYDANFDTYVCKPSP